MSHVRSPLSALLCLTVLLSACGRAPQTTPQATGPTLHAQDYATTAPPGSKGGPTDSAGTPLTPAWTATAAAKGKPPTNKFWSSILFKRNTGNAYSENMFAHPLALHARAGGLEIGYPTSMQIVGAPNLEKYEYAYAPDLTLGVSGLNSPDTKTDDWGDWTTTAAWSDGSNSLKATFGHGLPFVYATKTGGAAQVTFIATPTVWSNQGSVLGVTVNGHHYGLFAPTGATWTVSGTTATSTLGGKDYYSVAVLPDNTAATLSDFKTYAYNFVTGSTVSWAYTPGSASLNSTFRVTTQAKEGTGSGTLMALYRHQWLNSASVNTTYTYVSPRGQMKVARGSEFTTTQTFQGVLPYFPDNGSNNTLSKTQLAAFVQESNTPAVLNPTGDSYWTGKGLGKLAELVPLAEQVGNAGAQTAFLDAIQRVLEDWLDGKGSNLFAYNATWGTLIGYPEGYGSETELNDHHFHYGYFIKAAAMLAKYRPAWVAGLTPQGRTWGDSVNDLILDTGNWTTDISKFPRIRNFDAYAGHSWASGHSGFAAGNNQESSSEDMNYSTALINWGAVTGNTPVRDLGIFLYANETAAIEQYWFNQGGQVFPATFNKPAVGMVWGDGGAFSTWFSPDKEMIQGINFLPITAGSTYLGRNPAYLKTNYDFLGREPNAWKDIFWSVYALYDPAAAAQKFGTGAYTPEEGETKAHTYQFIHSLNAMGQVDTTVTANIPTYGVFKKGNLRTYAAYNPTGTPLTVNFSDGFSMTVGARKVESSLGPDPCTVDRTAPSVPGNLTLGGATGKSLTLNWSASSDTCGINRYDVFVNGVSRATTTTPTATLSGLTPDTAYAVKVRAVDPAGNASAFTPELTARTNPPSPCDTDTAAPTAPGPVTVSPLDVSLSLSWPASTDSCGVDHYELLVNGQSRPNVTAPAATLSGLTPDTAYEIRVRAVDTSGNASAYTTVNTRTQKKIVPDVPGVIADPAGSIVNGQSKTFPVSVTSAGTYRLSIQSAAPLNSRLIGVRFGTASVDIAVDAGQTVIVDFANIPAGAGEVTVTAKSEGVTLGRLSAANLSAPSDPCLGDVTAPSAPGTLSVSGLTASSATLSWAASSDACRVTRYEVLVDGVLKASPTTPGVDLTGLTAGTTYAVKVRALDAANNASAYTAAVNVTPGQTPPPTSGTVPGVITDTVGVIASGSSRTYDLTLSALRNVRLLITSAATSGSSAFTVSFNGGSVALSIGAGQTIPVDFANVTAGTKPLTITAGSGGVNLGKLEATTY